MVFQNTGYFCLNDDFLSIIKIHNNCINENIKITASTHGKSSFVFFVKDYINEYVYKFPLTNFSTKTIYKEQIVTNVLRSHLFCEIPEIKIEKFTDKVFSVYKKIEGENMSDVSLNETEMHSVANELVKFIIGFHSIPIKNFPFKIENKRESLELFCKDFGYSPKFEKISDLFDDCTLIHGDFHRSNLILKNKRLNGILDFATVSTGSKYFDLGHLMFSMYEKFNKLFIEEYENAVERKVNWNNIERVISFLDEMINKNYLPYIRRALHV